MLLFKPETIKDVDLEKFSPPLLDYLCEGDPQEETEKKKKALAIILLQLQNKTGHVETLRQIFDWSLTCILRSHPRFEYEFLFNSRSGMESLLYRAVHIDETLPQIRV